MSRGKDTTSVQGFDFRVLGALLLVAALVATICQRVRVPYSVGLVVAGVVLAALAPWSTPPLTRDLIFFVFLPPLIFEAAVQIPWPYLRRELPLLLALVTVGVVLAAAVVTVGMHWLVGWSWLGAGLFGVLIAATDPVAVIASLKETRVQPRLHLLVEAESLLNDGVAAVGFAVLAAIALGEQATPGGIAIDLIRTAAGGVACGAAVAVALIWFAGAVEDRLVELALTYLIAFGSFLVAENLHCSGVLATLTAGLIVGNWGFVGPISDEGRVSVLNHWEFVAFLINSAIFLLIGGLGTHMPVGAVLSAAGIAIVLTLAGRAATVYPVCLSFARTKLKVPWGYKRVLFWGGLRGALALALSLALPDTIPERGQIVTVAFAVVAFSIIVQGLTIPILIARLGLGQGTKTVSTATDDVSGQSSV